MSLSVIRFFDGIKKKLEYLQVKECTNEAIMHDLVVRPILIHPEILQWDSLEVLSQQEINFTDELTKSYIWKNAIPKKRRPDILINPLGYDKEIAVVEEKTIQKSLTKLRNYTPQLMEYMHLYNVVWGILTDGEKWIIKKNQEVFHEFSNLDELQRNLKDLQYCIGKKAISHRLQEYGTTDLVIIKHKSIIISTGLNSFAQSTFSKLLEANYFIAFEIIIEILKEADVTVGNFLRSAQDIDQQAIAENDIHRSLSIISHGIRAPLARVIGLITVLQLETESKEKNRILGVSREYILEWLNKDYPIIKSIESIMLSGEIDQASIIMIIKLIESREKF
ncbi:MAG: hypothetical protein RLP14_08235 [Owenweeksia sp.]